MVRPSQARKAAAEAEAASSGDKPADNQEEPDAAAAEEFGDDSSTYWPPGWNFDRFSKAGSLELLQDLTEDEISKLQAGIHEALGDAGRKKLSNYLARLALKRTAAGATALTNMNATPPDWLRRWTRRHRDQAWGFVAMQTACYDDVQQWNDFKERFHRIVEIPFERDVDYTAATAVAADASAAKAKFEIRWIEDLALDEQVDSEVLRQRYKEMRSSLPNGLSQNVFLVASKDAIASVLATTNNKDSKEAAPFTTSDRWQPNAPYILAVAAEMDLELEEDHYEREWVKPVFKVAVEVLVDEFWHILDSDFIPLRKITRFVKGVGLDGQATATGDTNDDIKDIWWTMAPSPRRLSKRRRIE